MDTEWYFRLLIPNISWFVVSSLLAGLIRPKRMTGVGPSRALTMIWWVMVVGGLVLTWFIEYSINPAFWIGVAIIICGEVIFTLGFIAMREHPEKNKTVVDWGIYRFNRHSHVLAGLICLLGVVIMGWQESALYVVLWVYFLLYAAMMHIGVLNEEKLNIAKFGQEYMDYMKKVPRYFPIGSKGSESQA